VKERVMLYYPENIIQNWTVRKNVTLGGGNFEIPIHLSQKGLPWGKKYVLQGWDTKRWQSDA
jgi:hypothetical protein